MKEIDKVKDDLQRLREDLGRMLGHLGSYSKGKFGNVRERVGERVEDLQGRAYDRVQGTAREAAERGWQAASASRGKVHERPLTSIALAFVAGLVLASLFIWKK